MEGLPEEIVLDILSRLPIKSLVLSKSVCQAWRRIIQDPVLINKRLSRMVSDQIQHDHPSFILQSNNFTQDQLYYGDFSSDHHDHDHDHDQVLIVKKLYMPPLCNFHLVSSCNGLLCLRASYPSFWPISIYNPFTKNYLELPKLTIDPNLLGVLGFGFVPTTKEYKVVQISYEEIRMPDDHVSRIESRARILALGSSTWRSLGSIPFNFRQQSQVLVNQKLHWLSQPSRCKPHNFITSFDLANEQFQDVPRPDFINLCRQFDQLVALRGFLSAAYLHDDEELQIWVMKEYDVKESWVKEFSINVSNYVLKTLLPCFKNSMFYWLKRSIRIVCQLRCGKMVLEYDNKALVLYDPHWGTFKDLQLRFEGIRKYFQVVVHVASLNWTNN